MESNSNEPRSVCVCGHTGDGFNSEHEDSIVGGHGSCTVEGCDCQQFTWGGFLEEKNKRQVRLGRSDD